MTKIKYLISFLPIVFLLNACVVSQNKYNDLLAEKITLEADLTTANQQIDSLQSEIDKLDREILTLQSDTATLHAEKRRISGEIERLTNEKDELQKYYDNLVANKAKLSTDLQQQQDELIEARKSLEIERKKNEELLDEISEREKRLGELETVLENEKLAVNRLKSNLTDALLNFGSDELKIEIKNGKVYVSLAEQLLFGSGSIVIDQKGKEAIKSLADVLIENPEISIMVEGHTDTDPIKGSRTYLSDNWDLSVLRATSVVNLLESYGIDPSRMIAAGRGEHLPIASNDLKEGKQKNRRTEIILTPQLDELFEILGSD
jgi:chemotaxis protein MotB